MANRQAKGFPRADDFRTAEGLAAAAAVFDRDAGSSGPFAEICKREWASCQQNRTGAAANSSAGWWRPMAVLRALRHAGGSRPLRDGRCQR